MMKLPTSYWKFDMKIERLLLTVLLCFFLPALASADLEKGFQRSMKKYNKIQSTINIGDGEASTIKKLQSIKVPQESSHEQLRGMTSKVIKKIKIDIYFMRTSWHEDGLTTDDEYTPYVFANNQLAVIGWDLIGGPKTKHNPALVLEYTKLKLLRSMERAQRLQNLGNALQNMGNSFQNAGQKIQDQTDRQSQINNQMQQTQELRNIRYQLNILNSTISR